MKIPLTRPFWGRQEEKAVINALKTGMGTGDGPWSKKLVKKLQEITKAKYVYPVTSCTHGLELAMAVLDIGIGDEVIVPSFTMTSTANCVVLQGATPVFADIEGKTYNIDPEDIEKLISRKTRGIIVVHYAGMPCRMEEILKIAKQNKLFVVEDAAHSIGAKYKGKALGTWGDMGIYSFHGTKNISCGEGGMVVTNNKILAEKMAIYRANGTNREKFMAGLINKYSWVEKGSSYFLSDILASIVYTQLQKMDKIITQRKKIASFYQKAFEKFQDVIQLPIEPPETFPNWHIFAIRFFLQRHAQVFIGKMRKKGIEVSPHYVPLHTSIAGRKFNPNVRNLLNTNQAAQTLVRLPIYPQLTKREMEYIVEKAIGILEKMR